MDNTCREECQANANDAYCQLYKLKRTQRKLCSVSLDVLGSATLFSETTLGALGPNREEKQFMLQLAVTIRSCCGSFCCGTVHGQVIRNVAGSRRPHIVCQPNGHQATQEHLLVDGNLRDSLKIWDARMLFQEMNIWDVGPFQEAVVPTRGPEVYLVLVLLLLDDSIASIRWLLRDCFLLCLARCSLHRLVRLLSWSTGTSLLRQFPVQPLELLQGGRQRGARTPSVRTPGGRVSFLTAL